jgi:hypothetical protein
MHGCIRKGRRFRSTTLSLLLALRTATSTQLQVIASRPQVQCWLHPDVEMEMHRRSLNQRQTNEAFRLYGEGLPRIGTKEQTAIRLSTNRSGSICTSVLSSAPCAARPSGWWLSKLLAERDT